MAWQYPTHACGHQGERYQAYGKMELRERQRVAIERQECPACRKWQAEQHASAAGLPILVGSDKQIAWASDIRARALRLLPADKADRLRAETSAKWWIEHRSEVGG
jgi:hypothetical protein